MRRHLNYPVAFDPGPNAIVHHEGGAGVISSFPVGAIHEVAMCDRRRYFNNYS
jgi:hypothetical protein